MREYNPHELNWGYYDNDGNYNPPSRPYKNGCSPQKSGCSCGQKDKTSAEIDRLKTLVSELEEKVKELAKKSDDNYEEPKGYWYFDTVDNSVDFNGAPIRKDMEYDKEIGNYFETKEEAEQAVEKLKAYKRLKDKGFRFEGWEENHHNLGIIEFSFSNVEKSVFDFEKDLDLLFGEED